MYPRLSHAGIEVEKMETQSAGDFMKIYFIMENSSGTAQGRLQAERILLNSA
jgi:hypothetical protein